MKLRSGTRRKDGRMVRHCRRLGRRSTIGSLDRTRCYHLRRTPAIHGCKLRAIGLELPRVLDLRRYGSHALFMKHRQFLRGGPRAQSGRTAVEAHAIESRHVWYAVVIYMANHRGVYVHHGAVVGEGAAIPITAVEAAPRITISVIDPAIEPDVMSPVAAMPSITAGPELPIRRRPDRPYIGRENPRSGHPVIAGRCVAPVTWSPQIIVAGAGGLRVFGQRRRRLRRFDHLLVLRIVIVVLRGRRISGTIVCARTVG